MEKKRLGGAGPNDTSKAATGLPVKRPTVQIVSGEKAGFRPNRREPIQDCCSASPVKCKGKSC